jgi:PAS domain S-box-containing protein
MTVQQEGKTEAERCAERHGRIALRALECLAETDSHVDAIHRLLQVLVQETGLQVAGVRLQEGGDCPFYEFNGLSAEAISHEQERLARGSGPGPEDCTSEEMCERVLRGQHHGQSDFTAGGSFFCPDLSVLSPKPSPCRCVREDFATLALLPLRQENEIIGVLHLADHRPGMLSSDDLQFLERLGASVGIALAQKQARRLQQLTDDTYRELFEQLGWGYAHHKMVFDAQGTPSDYVTLEVNRSFEELLRAPRDTVVGQPASALLPGPELARWLRIFGEVARTGKPATYETFSPHNQRHFRGHAYSLKRGHFSVAFEDVTDRFNAHALLAASEEKYRTLVETAEDTIILTDLEGRHLFRNSSYYTNLGYSPGELVCPDGYARVHPEDVQGLRSSDESLLAQGSLKFEYRVQHREGRWLWHSARSTLMRDATGRPYAFLSVIRDISEQKRAEEERALLQSQLLQAQKLETLGVLASGIAHDFNNILATILCGTDLADMKAGTLGPLQAADMRAELDNIRKAAQRASSLVKQILSLGRKGSQERQPLLLITLIKEACKFLRSALPSTIELQHNLTDDGPILANPSQIHQVIMNLLTNAGLAMPEGGRIEVGLSRAALSAPLRSRHPALPEQPYARIMIRDTGLGIAPENLGRIFEPFFTTRREGTGTGLGLAVAQTVVNAHGGAIDVTSEPGKGATFEVFLPIHEHQTALPELTHPPQPGKERILLVEDEELYLQMTRRGLAGLGYTVSACLSGLEALRVFRASPKFFDIVITDLTMPGITGDILARELRQIRPDVPIMLLTGLGESMGMERAKSVGIEDVLLKPVSLSHLTERLRVILKRYAVSR